MHAGSAVDLLRSDNVPQVKLKQIAEHQLAVFQNVKPHAVQKLNPRMIEVVIIMKDSIVLDVFLLRHACIIFNRRRINAVRHAAHDIAIMIVLCRRIVFFAVCRVGKRAAVILCAAVTAAHQRIRICGIVIVLLFNCLARIQIGTEYAAVCNEIRAVFRFCAGDIDAG